VPTRAESRKQAVILELFSELRRPGEHLDILNFTTDRVRELCREHEFRNPFDATNFDTIERLPTKLQDEGYFIVHLGRGDHAFVRGQGYHVLEPIQTTKGWPGAESLVDKLGISEASAISTMYNDRIIHDFLYAGSDADLQVHTARRSNATFSFQVNKQQLHADWVQVEIDGFFEGPNLIVPVNIKNGKRSNFEIRQMFTIMKYLEQFQLDGRIPSRTKSRLLYINRIKASSRDDFDIYEYRWKNPSDFNGFEFVKSVRYKRTGFERVSALSSA